MQLTLNATVESRYVSPVKKCRSIVTIPTRATLLYLKDTSKASSHDLAMERRLPPSNGRVSIEEPLTELFTPQRSTNTSDIDIPVTVHDEDSPLVTDAMVSLRFVNEEQTSFYGMH